MAYLQSLWAWRRRIRLLREKERIETWGWSVKANMKASVCKQRHEPVVPASLTAATFKIYHVAGCKPKRENDSASGKMLFDTKIQSYRFFSRYWTAKRCMGHPRVFQLDKCKTINVELISIRSSLAATNGAENKIIFSINLSLIWYPKAIKSAIFSVFPPFVLEKVCNNWGLFNGH